MYLGLQLRTFSVISSPLTHYEVTSDTLFLLVECTSCYFSLLLCLHNLRILSVWCYIQFVENFIGII